MTLSEHPPHVLIQAFGADPEPYRADLATHALMSFVGPLDRDLIEASAAAARAVVLVVGSKQLTNVTATIESLWPVIAAAGVHLALVGVDERRELTFLKTRFERPMPKMDLSHSNFAVLLPDPRIVSRWALTMSNRRPLSRLVDSGVLGWQLPQEEQTLLRRAFSDFDTVRLQELVPGKTSHVYRVEADRGPNFRPLPYLVKIGSRDKVIEEFENFVGRVADYVPFSWRPNLIEERCCLGDEKGIIVGHFIEDSVSLYDAVVGGAPVNVVHAVFDNLLRGWWRTGTKVADGTPVLAGMGHWVSFQKLKAARKDALTKHQALAPGSLLPDAISGKLDRLGPVTHHRSVIHGDLHAGNIRVHGDRVYLIDFGSVLEGPILADAAMLEISLLLEAGIAAAQAGHLDTWKVLLDSLFEVGWHKVVPAPQSPANIQATHRSIWQAVRVIRMHANGVRDSEWEYAQLIVAAIMRVAMFDDEKPLERTNCVAFLYEVASRVCGTIP